MAMVATFSVKSFFRSSSLSKFSLPLRPCCCSTVPDLSLEASRGEIHSPLKFWTSHEGLKQVVESDNNKGWVDEDGQEDGLLLAQLCLISSMAMDRLELHGNIGTQRDNWNKLFHSTLTTAAMTAAILAALDGHHKCLSFSLPAFSLNLGIAIVMSFINRFQPSQLAEEQRNASRLFKRLASDIEFTLRISPHLRQEATAYLAECQARILALDKAFPLPLYPNGLEKFPQHISLPAFSHPPDKSGPVIKLSEPENGWTNEICDELLSVADLATSSDMKNYIDWALEKLGTNKFLAIAAPSLATAGAMVNLLDAFGSANLGALGAILSVFAAFTGSIAHDGQVGMIFEMYRVCAAYFADMDASTQKAVRTPVEERENGLLFYQRIAYQLGRDPSQTPLVPPGSTTAGVLF